MLAETRVMRPIYSYLPVLTKPGGIFQQNFVKLCNTKFYENASGG